MAVTVDIRLETDLSEYDSTVTDGGDLSQSASAALAGSSGGQQMVIDDTTAIYGVLDFTPADGNDFRIRFYLDPNSLTMADGDAFTIHRSYVAGVSAVRIRLLYSSGSYSLDRNHVDDNGSHGGVPKSITDDVHYVEYHVKRASSAVASDGEFTWWIDGVQQVSYTNVDNYDFITDTGIDRVIFGAVDGLDVGTSGTFYLDEIKANDDGSEIGAFISGGFMTTNRGYW